MDATVFGVGSTIGPTTNSLATVARWGVEWLVKTDGGARSVPAFDFLREQPPAVRTQLLAIVDAVRTVGPDQWKDRTSHDSMHGSCAHLHEATRSGCRRVSKHRGGWSSSAGLGDRDTSTRGCCALCAASEP
jgi:hypothetical protein